MTQQSPDYLRELVEELKRLTNVYEQSCEQERMAKNELNNALANLKSTKQKIDSVNQEIMIEKKLIDAGR